MDTQNDFEIKVGASRPFLDVTVKQTSADGTVTNYPGTGIQSATFRMTAIGSTTRKINDQPATILEATATILRLRYEFDSTETDTAGEYFGEFVGDFGGGVLLPLPSNGHIRIRVVKRVP